MNKIIITILIFISLMTGGLAFAESSSPSSALDNVCLTNEQLLDRVAIEALSIEYFYLLDHGLADKIYELFTENGVMVKADGNVLKGREAIRKHYAARSKTRITRHISTNLRLVFESENRVVGTRTFTYYSADGSGPRPAIPSVAEYEEIYVRGNDGKWRYASRKITPIFDRMGQ